MISRARSARVSGLTTVALLLCAGCGTTHFSSSNTPTSGPAGNASRVATGPLLDAWWTKGSGGLQVVYGVPGAAHQASVGYNDGTYSGATVCMRGGFALLTSSSGVAARVQLPQGSPIQLDLPGISKPVVLFSPSCSSALEYSSSGSAAVLLQGLPSAPNPVSLTIPEGNSVLAVSDTGSVLLGANHSDGAVAVGLLTTGSSATKPITVLTKLGGAAFIPGSDAVLLADSGTNAVMEAGQANGSLSLTQVAGPRDGINNPVALGVSANGRTAVVANGTGSAIVRVDLSGQSGSTQAVCRCTPTELVPQAGNLSFRLNEPGGGTVWAFDGDASVPRTVFVPSEQTATATRGAR